MAGAFGAHGLRGAVSPELLAVWKTAALYQLVQGLALLVVALACWQMPLLQQSALVLWCQRTWLSGTLIFSGSLYALVLTGVPWLGAITPVGGTLMIIGWALLLWAALTLPRR